MKPDPVDHSSTALAALAGVTSLVLVLSLAGCSSSNGGKQTVPAGQPSAGMSKEEILKQEDVRGKTPTVFAQPLDKVREAALRALVFVGCQIKKHETYYLSGRRPNKMGFLVGSGGETVEVFLHPKSDTETEVWVDTDLSFMGIAGQQDWSKQTLEELTNLLSKPTANP